MTTNCMDSGSQIMTSARVGESVECGNCGAIVTVVLVPLKANDTNTINVIPTHDHTR